MNIKDEKRIKIGISIGDINGIGLEVIIKTFSDSRILEFCTPILFGSSKVISFHRKVLGIESFNFNPIKSADEAIHKKVNIVNCWSEDVKIDLGQSTETAGRYSLKSLESATEALFKNKIDALVTAPINKQNIQQAGFQFKGHTQYLTEQFDCKDSLMFLISSNIRVGIVTDHIPLKDVAQFISSEIINSKLLIMNESLKKDFGVDKPRIAVLGLNPHAGDNGLIGKEEEEKIVPAIKKAKEENIMVYGPYSADGFFGSGNYKNFDAILAMYHDQGLIPFKSLSFDEGVNFTAGLPVVRTSPDHGTAYDIAGKNLASEASFRQSIYGACDIFRRRKEYDILRAHAIKLTVELKSE